MVVIRLRRAGSKKRPFFRVVVTDSRAARDSILVEVLGHYNPRIEAGSARSSISERLAHWLNLGAQPSETVRTLVDRMPPAPPADAAPATAGKFRIVSRLETVVEASRRRWPTSRTRSASRAQHRGQTLVELSWPPATGPGDQAARGAPQRRRVRLAAADAELDGFKATSNWTMKVKGDPADLMLIGRWPGRTESAGEVIVNPETISRKSDSRRGTRDPPGDAGGDDQEGGSRSNGQVPPGTADRGASTGSRR